MNDGRPMDQTAIPVPAENTITACRSCGAKIFFARTPAMKDMPLDAKPVRIIMVDPLKAGETQHTMRWGSAFVSHFSTCPEADKFRGGGR